MPIERRMGQNVRFFGREILLSCKLIDSVQPASLSHTHAHDAAAANNSMWWQTTSEKGGGKEGAKKCLRLFKPFSNFPTTSRKIFFAEDFHNFLRSPSLCVLRACMARWCFSMVSEQSEARKKNEKRERKAEKGIVDTSHFATSPEKKKSAKGARNVSSTRRNLSILKYFQCVRGGIFLWKKKNLGCCRVIHLRMDFEEGLAMSSLEFIIKIEDHFTANPTNFYFDSMSFIISMMFYSIPHQTCNDFVGIESLSDWLNIFTADELFSEVFLYNTRTVSWKVDAS